MKAIVRKAQKKMLPRYDEKLKQDVQTLMVVVDVDFVHDDTGALVHAQTYSHLPADVDHAYYQRQADAMQVDFDHKRLCDEQTAIAREQSDLADKQLNEFSRKFGLSFVDNEVRLKDGSH